MLPRIESLHDLSAVSHVTPQSHARGVRLRINGNIAPRTQCSYPAKSDANSKADDPNNNGVLPFVQELHLANPPRLARARAIWLYASSMILFARIAIRMNTVAQSHKDRGSLLEDRLGLIVPIVASVLTILASLVAPKSAILVYLVNLVDKPLRWLLKRKASTSPEI